MKKVCILDITHLFVSYIYIANINDAEYLLRLPSVNLFPGGGHLRLCGLLLQSPLFSPARPESDDHQQKWDGA